MAAADRLILLTGASGFVGRQILRELNERGLKVRIIVRTGSQDKIAPAASVESIAETQDLWSEGADWCAQACCDVDTVIHAAWYAEPGQYLLSPKNADCLAGTLRLAQGAMRGGVRRFVGLGTCFEYAHSDMPLSVETPLHPASPYAVAKADTFHALSKLLPQAGVAFVWARLFYLYGEGEDSRRLVPYLRSRLSAGEPADLGSGLHLRDYMDVRDAARMIVDVALGTVQGPVNICSGKGVSIRELAERIADEYGRRDLLRFGARPDNAADSPSIVGLRA